MSKSYKVAKKTMNMGPKVTIYISIHPLNRLYLKAIQEMLKFKNDWI